MQAMDVKTARLSPGHDIIFIGSGCYGDKPSPKIIDFIEANDFKNRKVALFGTSGAGEGKELIDMEKASKQNQARVIGRFHCKGRALLLVNRKHPTPEDLSNARKFATQMII
jgi:flavodoxin I